MDRVGWEVGIEYAAEGQGITNSTFYILPIHDVLFPREDAMGACLPCETPHGNHCSAMVCDIVASFSIVESEDHPSTDAQSVDDVIELMSILVRGEVV